VLVANELVKDTIKRLNAGEGINPLVVAVDGERLNILDGYHRAAAQLAKQASEVQAFELIDKPAMSWTKSV